MDVPTSFASLARLAAQSLTAAKAPAPASLALIFADDAELAELNATHMGVTGPTDVLSFPLLPASAFPGHEGKQLDAASGAPTEPDYQPPPGQRRHLGDIVISIERAIEQARDGRGGARSDLASSAPDEVRLLVVHGVLHVCGWDHADPAEDAAMRALERRILAQR